MRVQLLAPEISSLTAKTVLPKRRWVTSTLKRPCASCSRLCCGRGTWPVATSIFVAVMDQNMRDNPRGALARRRSRTAEAAVEQFLDRRQSHGLRLRSGCKLLQPGDRVRPDFARFCAKRDARGV